MRTVREAGSAAGEISATVPVMASAMRVHPHGEFRVRQHVAGEQARDIGHQAQAGAAFQFEQRFAGHRQVALVRELAGHHAVERGEDLRVAGQRLRLGHGGFGDVVARLRGVQFGLRGGVLLAQIRRCD